MFKKILQYFPPTEDYRTYIEAFGGGASVLLQKPDIAPVEIYNDVEQNVYSLFKVLADPQLFTEFKALCDIAIFSDQLRREFKLELQKDDISIVNRAFYFWFVNRTSRNGIGGFKINRVIRRGMAKSTCDFLSSVAALKDLHERLSSVIIDNRDAVALFEKYRDDDSVFFYLDPPYHQETRTATRYRVDFTPEQHTALINIAHTCTCKVLISGYAHSSYDILTDMGWECIKFDIATKDGMNRKKVKTECLWRNYSG